VGVALLGVNGIMREVYNNLAIWVPLVVVAALICFVPSIVARCRRLKAFQSISALNALMVLAFVCAFFSSWFLWVTAVLWVVTATWAIVGKRNDT
jgi:hypothetical protein